jgi:putative DNA methylase
VGRVLGSEREEVAGLDPITTYYLLHRHDFKFEKVPVGASILYAISCGLRDTDLIDRYELLARSGGSEAEPEADSGDEEVDDADDAEATAGLSGSKVRLLRWSERRRTLRSSAREGGPLIDHIHQLLYLWKAGDQDKVNTFVAAHGLGTSVIFRYVLQALIELSEPGDSERALLEAISNHVGIELPSRRDIGLFEPV